MLCTLSTSMREQEHSIEHFFPIPTSPPPLVPHSARCSVVMCVHKAYLRYYNIIYVFKFMFFFFFSYILFSSFLSARRTILLFSTHSLHFASLQAMMMIPELNWTEAKCTLAAIRPAICIILGLSHLCCIKIDAYDDFEIEPVANVDNKMNVTNELLECSREYLHTW